MKVASWNVNSVRARLDHVLEWYDLAKPDVLCLQETKVKDENFPEEEFKTRGLNVYKFGMPAYHGVAIVSHLEAEDVQLGFKDDADGYFDKQKRLIAATFNGVRVVNVYAPNGDNDKSDKFVYKEKWFEQLRSELVKYHDPAQDDLLICGDFNIAPKDIDVADPEGMLGRCGFHPKEHVWFEHLMSWGFDDVFRNQNQDLKGAFSWWDYRQNSYIRNRGMRIDNIITTKPLTQKCVGTEIDRTPREWEKPSDHTPVIAEFKL